MEEQLFPQAVQQLTSKIQEHGLAEQTTTILESARPAILFKLGEPGLGTVGQSRIGGNPDLPASMPWPTLDMNEAQINEFYGDCLCFILQINLAELPDFPGKPLPEKGMLYLFAGEDTDDARQVVFYEGTEPLSPRATPPRALVTDWYSELAAHTLAFELVADVPRWYSKDYQVFCDRCNLNNALEDNFDELTQAINRNSIGRLLGYAAGIGHDTREDAFIVRDLEKSGLFFDYDRKATTDMTPAANWQHLLTVETVNAVNLMFGDAGYLQVLIHQDDLAQMDVSRVYVELASS